MSFALTLLDGNNNGICISSIYGRSESRIFSKPIVKGKSLVSLSQEELESLNEALGERTNEEALTSAIVSKIRKFYVENTGIHFKQVERNGDNCILTLTTKQAKLVAIIGSVVLVLALVLGIWGIVRQAEIVQLRQQTQLQSEQLKLLQQKTEVLDKKIQNLNQISEENKQMLKGAESGTPAQGGGDGSDPKQEAADNSEAQTLTAAQLSARLSKMDKEAQKLLVSFYTMRNILRDGGAQDLMALQSINFSAGSGGAVNSTTPSIWPSKGVITSPFGSRVDPVTGAIGAFHEGIDIADDYGSQIVATAAGVVTFAGYTSGGYGNLVEIDHGNGFVTRYGHNSAVLVTVGMSVKQGQTIALMGSTGKSTGAHVHYEVRLNNTPVDPMIFLPISN